jgi:1,2-diacylglycerol 3-alpha-glucosyltransferase
MRILLTTPSYPPFNSGLGNAVAQQAVCLARAGHEVVVATGGELRERRDEAGIRIETFALSGADSWLQPIRGEVSTYLDFLRSHHWDVVLLNAWQNWATDLALRNLSNLSGRRFVYSHCVSTNVFYSSQPFRSCLRFLAWRPYWWRLSRYMKQLDGVLFLAGSGSDSRFDDLRLARKLRIPFRIVPNSISPAALAVLGNPSRYLASRDRLIAVGSYQWQKGFDFVLRAYAASQARHRFSLHLYGQAHSPYSDTLRALARRLGLQEGQVEFHAGVSGDSLVAAYCQARLILSGSHTECQPLVLLDANAAGTPFIARNTGCIASMPGGVGVSSSLDMATQIDALADNTAAWEALADSGRQAAQRTYHPDLTTEQLLAALGELGCQAVQ